MLIERSAEGFPWIFTNLKLEKFNMNILWGTRQPPGKTLSILYIWRINYIISSIFLLVFIRVVCFRRTTFWDGSFCYHLPPFCVLLYIPTMIYKVPVFTNQTYVCSMLKNACRTAICHILEKTRPSGPWLSCLAVLCTAHMTHGI